MSALLTYRSRDSFESRFGRNVPNAVQKQDANGMGRQATTSTLSNEHFDIHNEGHRNAGTRRSHRTSSDSSSTRQSVDHGSNPPLFVGDARSQIASHAGEIITIQDPEVHGATPFQTRVPTTQGKRATTYFSAQSYLRYQGEKFIKRFDANCYIAITRKLDTHDVSVHCSNPDSSDHLVDALAQIEQPTLVLGIKSDGLFTFAEQQEIAKGIPRAELKTIDSPEGHDAFLLQFEQVNSYILDFFAKILPDILARSPTHEGQVDQGNTKITKNSTFGEAEVDDITAW